MDYKILLIGDKNVGKKSFLYRIGCSGFSNKIPAMHVSKYLNKKFLVNERNVSLVFINESNSLILDSIQFTEQIDGIILFYDISNKASIKGLYYWADKFNRISKDIQFCLVGNKMDIKDLLQIVTVIGLVSLTPLAAIVPWSRKLVVEDYGYYGLIYVDYHYNTSIALIYIIPLVSLIVVNKWVKNYFWRVRAETRKFCIICGKSDDYARKFCSYCGNDL